jgi:hypothetical protein
MYVLVGRSSGMSASQFHEAPYLVSLTAVYAAAILHFLCNFVPSCDAIFG